MLDAIRRGHSRQFAPDGHVQQHAANLQRLMNHAARKRNAALGSSNRRKLVLYQGLRNGSRAIVAIYQRLSPDAEEQAVMLNHLP
jgi:hypothetical protein